MFWFMFGSPGARGGREGALGRSGLNEKGAPFGGGGGIIF